MSIIAKKWGGLSTSGKIIIGSAAVCLGITALEYYSSWRNQPDDMIKNVYIYGPIRSNASSEPNVSSTVSNASPASKPQSPT